MPSEEIDYIEDRLHDLESELFAVQAEAEQLRYDRDDLILRMTELEEVISELTAPPQLAEV